MVAIPVDKISAELEPLLCPKSIVVVGASRQRGTIGAEILHNIISFGFTGEVYAVNPSAAEVQGVRSYPSVLDIPVKLDCAIIAVPSAAVLAVAKQCGQKGLRNLVVISSGFSEVGGEGVARQAELRAICQQFKMRLVGPNCMGIANTAQAIRLNATFSPTPPESGRVALLTQSGAVGLAIIEYARSLDLGLSYFVSVGNKADISSNDLLQFWETDNNTDVILLYIESFGNPQKFATIAPRVARKKPIIAVKSGRSLAGARAAQSHTGALLGSSDRVVDALLRQSGVIRANSLEELFGVASILAHQPVPRGNRVAIVTNAGGPGIMCADACEHHELIVPELDEKTRQTLLTFLPPQAGVSNPVDMIASATPQQFKDSIIAVAADDSVDAIVVIYIPPLVSEPEAIADSIVAAVKSLPSEKPVIAVLMTHGDSPQRLRTSACHVPTFLFPETAIEALAQTVRYGAWRRLPEQLEAEQLPVYPVAEAAALLLNPGKDGWLAPDTCAQLLDMYGIHRVQEMTAENPQQVVTCAQKIGGTVVLKGVAAGLVHKTERGAVRLHLSDPAEILKEALAMEARLQSQGFKKIHFLVQEMAAGGTEMIVGSMYDPKFGPVLVVGAGGIFSELISDITVRLPPITKVTAAQMVNELRCQKLLDGYRSAPAADRRALEEILVRLSHLVTQHLSIREIDLNPVVVTPKGAVVVDCRVRVAESGL